MTKREYPEWMKRHPHWIAAVEQGDRYLAEGIGGHRLPSNVKQDVISGVSLAVVIALLAFLM
jgi:hypothetical protein